MNATSDIFDAVKEHDLDRIRRLLRDDPSLAAARNDAGLSVVLLARYYGRTEALASLLASGPHLDIFEASAVGDTARTRTLLDADPFLLNAHGADGHVPLSLAAFFGHHETVTLLLERGADVHAVARNDMCVQALHAALAGGHDQIARTLIAFGADVNATQQDSYTPLHEAAQNGSPAMVELLLAHGADPSAQLADGRTPADIAAASGHTAIAERLRLSAR